MFVIVWDRNPLSIILSVDWISLFTKYYVIKYLLSISMDQVYEIYLLKQRIEYVIIALGRVRSHSIFIASNSLSEYLES